MANPILKVRRRLTGAAGAPASMVEGEIAVNFVDEKVYIHNGTSAVPVAGKGEFVDLGSEQSVTGKKNFTSATVSTVPADANDVIRKTELDGETASRIAGDAALGLRIDALGSAFNYVGTVSGGADAANATDLTALTEKDAGDYYKVSSAGHFNDGTSTFFANANDGIVFDLAGGVDLIDNTNSSVSGTVNEIAVTGSADTGFVVAIDSVFSGRVTTAETDIDNLEGRMTNAETDIDNLESKTQNIDLAGTVAGTTVLTGALQVSGAVEVTGNLVGNGTNEITDFIIDGGTF